MKRSIDRILTTHAGSLPRPVSLVELQLARYEGKDVDDALLEAEARAATEAVVQRQIETGIDIINNGEQARESFFTYVQHRMSGFGGTSTRPPFQDMVRYPGWLELKIPGYGGVSLTAAPQAQGPVRYENETPLREELALFDQALQRHDGEYVESFVTAPSPGIVAAAMQNVYYPSLDAYIDALAEALSVEYRAIVGAGHVLQIDAPDLAMERHTYFGERSEEDFLRFMETVVRATARALDDVPREQTRLHVCWGNYDGPHDCDVPLATILPTLTQAYAGALMISLANPRHAHEVPELNAGSLPEGLVVIAGVIDTTSNYVEHPEVVANRITAVAESMGDPRRVIAGTDCGFDTAAGFRDVAEDVAWAKLGSLVEGARRASERLF